MTERNEQGQFIEQGEYQFDKDESSDIAWNTHRKKILEKYNLEDNT